MTRVAPSMTKTRWRETAKTIIERDGGICHLCGQPGADIVHHLRGRRQGGTNHPENLRAVHRTCHYLNRPSRS
ncbi:HNH endonuclease [Nitrospirillum bahiense]|uniref:HNH endonuclease n=1 Tax=Nitrospirillum amazonense TaxID=28077 RepID=UPI0011A1DA81